MTMIRGKETTRVINPNILRLSRLIGTNRIQAAPASDMKESIRTNK